tara:strand:- start:1629 stop:1868 length:240 start_codon:yes stop_codon:yes gene_type:complete
MTMDKISQDEMLVQFKDRYSNLITENQQLAESIKKNEVQALKLQGAIEALEYYAPPEETPPEIEGDDVTDGSPELTETE